MKEMCKLVDTDYPFLSVYAPTYSVEFIEAEGGAWE